MSIGSRPDMGTSSITVPELPDRLILGFGWRSTTARREETVSLLIVGLSLCIKAVSYCSDIVLSC